MIELTEVPGRWMQTVILTALAAHRPANASDGDRYARHGQEAGMASSASRKIVLVAAGYTMLHERMTLSV